MNVDLTAPFAKVPCPHCKSEDITEIKNTKRKIIRWLQVPWLCNECDSHWNTSVRVEDEEDV